MGNFYEFFAGGGMARAGLGPAWQCLFANDFDARKAASYAANWGSAGLRVDDVSHLVSADLPGHADLAWASFPCQDLSLAGAGAGLNGQRSSSFWPFWRLITALGAEGRAPSLIALENVCGALSSHGGKDFAAIGDAMADGGYRFGAIIIDAIDFVPQSRPRLFLIGVHQSLPIPGALLAGGPQAPWHPPTLTSAFGKLSARAQNAWEWWRLPAPPARAHALADLVEEAPEGVIWHSEHETARLIGMMNTRNLEKSGSCSVPADAGWARFTSALAPMALTDGKCSVQKFALMTWRVVCARLQEAPVGKPSWWLRGSARACFRRARRPA